jgi:hypothetical protein
MTHTNSGGYPVPPVPNPLTWEFRAILWHGLSCASIHFNPWHALARVARVKTHCWSKSERRNR